MGLGQAIQAFVGGRVSGEFSLKAVCGSLQTSPEEGVSEVPLVWCRLSSPRSPLGTGSDGFFLGRRVGIAEKASLRVSTSEGVRAGFPGPRLAHVSA